MICLQNHYFFENTDHDVSFCRIALHIFTNTVKSLTDNILFPFYSHFRFFVVYLRYTIIIMLF